MRRKEEVANIIYRGAEQSHFFALNGMRPDSTQLPEGSRDSVLELSETLMDGMQALAAKQGLTLSLDLDQVRFDTGQMMMDMALELKDVNGNSITTEQAREQSRLGREMRDNH